MRARFFILTSMFVAGSVYLAHAMRPEQIPLREPLSQVPREIAGWSGRDNPPLAEDVLNVLGADEYLDRTYLSATEAPVGLYIGYYASQRQGDAIHSPLNCLPGAGWEPVSMTRVEVPVDGRPSRPEVNRFLIQKGPDRQVVYYWYQSHGRVVASEYWSKAYLMYDAFRLNRTDAAMVRVISPIVRTEFDDTHAAGRVDRFVRALLPLLEKHLPS